ncbi:hypothetical protein GCM10010260_40750 [Streptomyces filipinensis]|uniref:Uncharacterized protein n=1 Tax=Streptomyces filipinensis TaxID=66887 RepID=A0A918MBA4_9ACTN|nr:hypothetical protein GCM10010260_40750 [Streptomyces filipinensis]
MSDVTTTDLYEVTMTMSYLRVERDDAERFAAALHRPARDLEPLRGLSFAGEVRAVGGACALRR